MKGKWWEMFPEGRRLFYEGKNPAQFVTEMKRVFDFDPSDGNPHWNAKSGWPFDCPPQHLDEVYSGKYPVGS